MVYEIVKDGHGCFVGRTNPYTFPRPCLLVPPDPRHKSIHLCERFTGLRGLVTASIAV